MSQEFKRSSKGRTNSPAYPFLLLIQQFQVPTRSNRLESSITVSTGGPQLKNYSTVSTRRPQLENYSIVSTGDPQLENSSTVPNNRRTTNGELQYCLNRTINGELQYCLNRKTKTEKLQHYLNRRTTNGEPQYCLESYNKPWVTKTEI